MRRALIVLIVLMAAHMPVSAQEDDSSGEVMYRHTISGGPSVADVVSGDGPESSSLGLDYLYRLNAKWEIGVQLDFNYGKNYDGFEGYAVVPIVSYSVTERFPVFVGAGLEHRDESGDDEFLLRAGFEYVIPLAGEERWALLPGGFVDFVDSETILSAVVAIGYSF